jgi:nitrous oxidase accessory protein NosD
MRTFPTSALAIVLLVSLPPADVQAAVGDGYDTCKGFIDTVPATLTEGGTWCLRSNLATPIASGAAITIAAYNVTLDCHGYRISNNAAGTGSSATGIRGNRIGNTTIRRCTTRGFRVGIGTSDADLMSIEDNTVDGATEYGISAGGSRINILRNRVMDIGTGLSADTAYGIAASGDGVVSGNSIAGVGRSLAIGIYSVFGSDIVIADNRIRDVEGAGSSVGIYLNFASSLTIRGNDLAGTDQPDSRGILCTNQSSALVYDNAVTGFADPTFGTCTTFSNVVEP